jgi:hypothetical protein
MKIIYVVMSLFLVSCTTTQPYISSTEYAEDQEAMGTVYMTKTMMHRILDEVVDEETGVSTAESTIKYLENYIKATIRYEGEIGLNVDYLPQEFTTGEIKAVIGIAKSVKKMQEENKNTPDKYLPSLVEAKKKECQMVSEALNKVLSGMPQYKESLQDLQQSIDALDSPKK